MYKIIIKNSILIFIISAGLFVASCSTPNNITNPNKNVSTSSPKPTSSSSSNLKYTKVLVDVFFPVDGDTNNLSDKLYLSFKDSNNNVNTFTFTKSNSTQQAIFNDVTTGVGILSANIKTSSGISLSSSSQSFNAQLDSNKASVKMANDMANIIHFSEESGSFNTNVNFTEIDSINNIQTSDSIDPNASSKDYLKEKIKDFANNKP